MLRLSLLDVSFSQVVVGVCDVRTDLGSFCLFTSCLDLLTSVLVFHWPWFVALADRNHAKTKPIPSFPSFYSHAR